MPDKRAWISFLIFAFTLSLACTGRNGSSLPGLRGPYLGQNPPGMTPEIFAPGFFSTEANEFNASFTPDGKEVYFTSNVNDKEQIMVIREIDGIWTERETASFSGTFRDVDPYVTFDGERIYFSSNRSLNEMAVKRDCDFWFVEKSKKDGWSDPQHVESPANQGKDDYYFITTKSGTIYYSVFYEGTGDIFCMHKTAEGFDPPVRLGQGISTEYNEHDPYIAPDERFLIFTSNRPGGHGSADLYITFKNPDHSWTEPVNMGERINSDRYDYCPILSPDSKYLFFTSTRTGNGDVYWVDAKIIDTLKPNSTER